MKRLLAGFLFLSGLLVAGVANANVVATPTVDCQSAGSLSVTTATGIVGDTIVVSNIGSPTCATSIADTAVVTTTAGNSIPFQGTRTFTLAGAGTTTIQFSNLSSTIGAGTITVTVTSPSPPAPPQPIPTLSEWVQIMMMLMMIATAGFYGWRMKQR